MFRRIASPVLVSLVAVTGASSFAFPAYADTASDVSLVTGPLPFAVRAGTPQSLIEFVHEGGPTGTLRSGAPVVFDILEGPNAGINITVPTNADGAAVLHYPTKDLVPGGGTDTVRAYVDINGNSALDENEPVETTDLVTLPTENQPPVAGDVAISVEGDSTTSIRLSGSDPDGLPVGFAIVDQPDHGTVPTFLSGPFVDYTPANGFRGDDSFTYVVTDSDGAQATSKVSIEVRSPEGTTPTPVPQECAGRVPTIVVVEGQGPVFGTGGPDVIAGSAGDDEIYALDGDDVVCGNGGNDVISGGGGNDIVSVGPDASNVYGNDGDDLITASGSGHTIDGGNGNDYVFAGDDAVIDGGDGDDSIKAGDSVVRGGNGNDTMDVAGGTPGVWGGDGDDKFLGPASAAFDGGNGNNWRA